MSNTSRASVAPAPAMTQLEGIGRMTGRARRYRRVVGAVELTGGGLAAGDVVAVARHDAHVRLGAEAEARMIASARAVQLALDAPDPAYGVSTGFGSLANVVIPADRRAELQRALVRSHAAGMGPPVEREV